MKREGRKEVVRKFYNNFAEDYERSRYSSDKQKRIDEHAKAVVLNLVGSVEHKTVLDCGCGTGRFASLLVEGGAKVVGMDISKNMIKIAKEKTPSVAFIIGDVLNMPFKEKQFEIVVCSQVLTHLHQYKKPLLEMKRVINQNGTIIIDIRNILWPFRPLQILKQKIMGHGEYDPHFTQVRNIKKTCNEIGLEIEEFRGVGFHFKRIKYIAPTLILKIKNKQLN